MKTALRILGRICAAGLGLVVLLLALSAAILSTEAGRKGLLSAITEVTAGPDFRLELHGLNFDAGLELHTMTIADASGIWLEVQNARLIPDLGQLLRGRVVLHQVRATKLSLARLPAANASTTNTTMNLPPIWVERLDLDQIHLGQDVLGQEARLTAHSEVAFGPGAGEAQGEIARLDRTDALHFMARLTPATAELDLELQEQPGGLLHALLDLPGGAGITARVTGQGSRHAWPAQITASVGDLLDLTGNATIALAGDPEGAWTARVDLGPALLRHVPAMPAPTIHVDGRALWREGGLVLSRLDLRTAAASLTMNGTWAGKGLALAAQASATDLAWIMPDGIRSGPAEMNATLRLGPQSVVVNSTTQFTDWRVHGQPVSGQVNATCILHPDLQTWQAQGALQAALPGMTPNHVAANATISANATTISLDTLNVASPGVRLALSGAMDEHLYLTSTLDLIDLSIPGMTPLRARLNGSVNGTLDHEAQSFSGTVTTTASHLSGLPEQVTRLLGPQAKLDAEIIASPDVIQIRSARLASRTTVSAHGEFQPRTQAFSTRLAVTLPELTHTDFNVQGLALNGSLTGTSSNFAATLTSRAQTFTAHDLRLTTPTLQASINDLPAHPRIDLSVQAKAAGETLDLRTQATWTQDTFVIGDATLILPGTTARFSGTLDQSSPIPTGTVTVDSQDLGAVGRVVGQDLGGSLSASANIGPTGTRQKIQFRAQGTRLALAGVNMAALDLDGVYTPGQPQKTRIQATARTLVVGPARADRVSANVTGASQWLSAKVALDHTTTQTALLTSARMAWTEHTTRLELQTVEGRVLGQNVHLLQPLRVDISPGQSRWTDATLRLGRTKIQTKGLLASTCTATVAVRDLDLDTLARVLPDIPHGRLNAQLDLSGSRTRPDLDLRLDAAGLRTDAKVRDLPELTLQARGKLHANALTATARIEDPRTGMQATGEFSCPLKLSLDPPAFDLPPGTPLAGAISANPDLRLVPRFLRLDDQSASGQTNLHFLIGGVLNAPTLTGAAQVQNATYENHRTGTRLADIQGSVQANGAEITLALASSDGQTGRVDAQGSANMQTRTYDADITLHNAKLLRLDSFQSTVNGTMRAHGDEKKAWLRGVLTLDPSEFRLPRSIPADLPHIDITQVNARAPHTTPVQPLSPFATDLNIELDVPGRFFVKGRGLDSEWSGKIQIKGSHANPRITGTATLIRGRFDFLDRIFELTRGSLNLDGSTPPNPYLDVIGETEVLETTTQVHLLGPAKNFRLSLSSVPVLPADEILALILFGRSSRQISPLQAIRLAQAASELTGIGTTPDFFDSIKTRLGLQEITVDKDGDDATNVGIGGYVGGKYYIRTQRSVSGQDKTKIEIQLTPRISVETEIGADSRQGGGVTWKHDY